MLSIDAFGLRRLGHPFLLDELHARQLRDALRRDGKRLVESIVVARRRINKSDLDRFGVRCSRQRSQCTEKRTCGDDIGAANQQAAARY